MFPVKSFITWLVISLSRGWPHSRLTHLYLEGSIDKLYSTLRFSRLSSAVQVVWSLWQMSDKRLPKLILKGPVLGLSLSWEPGSVWNDVSLSGVHHVKLSYHSLNAHNMPVWKELACIAHIWAWWQSMRFQLWIFIINASFLQVHCVYCTKCNMTGFM